MKKLMAIDGHSILNRAFYGMPPLTNSAGVHTNAVFGFMNTLLMLLDEEHPDYLAVAFDRKEPTFRHEMFSAYKGTRKGMPEELHEQVPITKKLVAACGIPVFELPGYEADDILGTLRRQAEEAGMEVTLVSGDRDLLQLATEKTRIRIPKTKGGKTVTENYYADDVVAAYGVTPKEFIDVKALMGDTSDNIPGVPGIGEKTATALIQKYHSIENIRDNLEEVKPPRARNMLTEHFDMAVMSRKLAEICDTAPLTFDPETAAHSTIFTKEAYEIIAGLELKRLLKRFEAAAADPVDGGEEDGSGSGNTVRAILSGKDLEEIGQRVKEGCTAGILLLYDPMPGSEEAAESRSGKKKKKTLTGAAVCCSGEDETWALYIKEEPGGIDRNKIAGFLSHVIRVSERSVTADLKALLHEFDIPEDQEILDAGVAAYLVNPLKSAYDITDIAAAFLSDTSPIAAETQGAGILLAAAGPMKEILKEKGMLHLYEEIELPLIYALYHMETAGIKVRRDALKEYGDNLTGSIAELEQEIFALAGVPFNIHSPKQLGEVLFDRMKLPYAKKTKTGYSTNADVMEKLKEYHPIAEKVLSYRTLTKLKSTYADGLAAFIGDDERIHGHFNQTITATGRISSTDPNLQNIPVRMELGREIRKVFVPEDGCVFVDADYSQIELRVLAHMSGDEKLIEAYNQDQDIHRITASQVFHIPFEEVTPEMRRNAKAVNFGIVYGISAFGLSEDLSITRKEAEEYIKRYFETYPQVKVYLDALVARGKRLGFVTTLYGRIRPIPELKASNFMQRQFGERVAMNSPIQGTAADIMKIAMIRVDRALRDAGLKARIVLQVHDELLLEVPEEEKEQAEKILYNEMQNAAALKVPLEVAVSAGHTWFETK